MTDNTDRLGLPFILPAQAQKHLTHNEALAKLDALVQASCLSVDLATPPSSPTVGDAYLIAPTATGDWAGHDHHIGVRSSSGWTFHEPKEGWIAWAQNRGALMVFDGNNWLPFSPSSLASTPLLNRDTATDDAGFIWQTAYQSTALFGQFGSSDMRLAMSNDGTSFTDSVIIDSATGILNRPQNPRFKAHLNYNQLMPKEIWEKVNINVTETNDQGCFDPVTSLFTAPLSGDYLFGGSALYEIDVDAPRVNIRLLRNGTDEISGSRVEYAGTHVSRRTAVQTVTVAKLNSGDTVEFQSYSRRNSSYFRADGTAFWGSYLG